MNSIELMIEEHKNIKRMLQVVRSACFRILQGETIFYEDFDEMIDFIRNYADSHHHGKEEKFLFKEMVDRLGVVGSNLITHGMLVEHDYGRLYISELKSALERVKNGDEESKLDIISNAVGYANHLNRHIIKEDSVVYTYADKNLPKEVLVGLNEKTEVFEEEATKAGIQNKYIEILEKLEKKYKNN